VEAIIAEREAHGPFTSLGDLCRRIDLQRINRRVLEALLRSGSPDALGPNRATLMQRLPAAMQLGDQTSKAHEAGQNDLFGLGPAVPAAAAATPVDGAPLQEWTEAVRLAGERETLGLYLTGHPAKPYASLLGRVASHRIGDLVSERPAAGAEPARFGGGKPVTVGGLIDEVKKRGSRFILTLDDSTGRLEVTLFEDAFQKYREVATKDALVLVEGLLRFDDFSDGWRLSARSITDLGKMGEQQARRIILRWPRERADTAALQERLAELLAAHRPGPCTVVIDYSCRAARGALELGPQWAVRPTSELREGLEALLGRGSVGVKYAPLAAAS
jgi:DNA polymerase-3 subunit alpha